MPLSDIRGKLGEAFFPQLGLSYHDVRVTPEDIKCLRGDWLTDNNIAFWEEYLERETLPQYPHARVVLLRPTMAFLLMKDPNINSVRDALPSFNHVTHVFLPINDSSNVSVGESGSHWSLLVVSIRDGVAFHYDSLVRSNILAAWQATERFNELLGLTDSSGLRFIHLEDSPQQENGRDCGVFVCLIMRHLLIKRLLNASSHEKVSMSMGGKIVDAFSGRKEMLKIIEVLRKEGERRRSSSPFSKKTPPRIE